jgi:hypothetical protein
VLVAYITLDEVNLALADELAEKCGAVLCGLTPGDAAPNGSFDAIAYDLDHLPQEERKRIIAELLANSTVTPVAVHSYNLDEEAAESLRKRGVGVFHRLEEDLFASWHDAALALSCRREE